MHMIKNWVLITALGVLWAAGERLEIWDASASLQEVQAALGEKRPEHYLPPDEDLARVGEDLVRFGRAIGPNGKRTKYISKYYVCTTCHKSYYLTLVICVCKFHAQSLLFSNKVGIVRLV